MDKKIFICATSMNRVREHGYVCLVPCCCAAVLELFT